MRLETYIRLRDEIRSRISEYDLLDDDTYRKIIDISQSVFLDQSRYYLDLRRCKSIFALEDYIFRKYLGYHFFRIDILPKKDFIVYPDDYKGLLRIIRDY